MSGALPLAAVEPSVQGATPRRPALRYFGGKWRLAPWILQHFPDHHCYCEPFGGGGSVLLRKRRSRAECYNDLDGRVVNFFRVLRDRGPELVRAIELTPFAREEFELAENGSADGDPLEDARRTYVACWQSMHAGLRINRTGWRHCRGTARLTTAAHEFAQVEHLTAIVERLRAVQIEHAPAIDVMRRFDSPETLHYVDPPYPKATRGHRWGRDGYRHEMADRDHVELLEVLRSLAGMVVVSGYRCPIYDEGLNGWTRVDRDHRTMRSDSVESLWLSPRTAAELWPLGRIS